MLTVFGVGEVPISLSGDPAEPGPLSSTPFATSARCPARWRVCVRATPLACAGRSAAGWPMAEAAGRDVVIVAGGLGLAPLRPVLYRAACRARALRQDRAALRRA